MSVKRPIVANDESEFSYTDKLSGRRLAFTPATDEAVVTFHRPPSETDISDAIESTPLAISGGLQRKAPVRGGAGGRRGGHLRRYTAAAAAS